MSAALPEPRLTYGLREGLEVGPVPGDDTIPFWLMIANDESRHQFERVGAVIALFQKGVRLHVQQVVDG